jgi:hypothetical protein
MRLSTFVPLMILSCTAHAAERPYAPPRLDNGQPDMQGVWIASNATPLQRPAGFATLVIDEVQAAKSHSDGERADGDARPGAAARAGALPRVDDHAAPDSLHTQRRQPAPDRADRCASGFRVVS